MIDLKAARNDPETTRAALARLPLNPLSEPAAEAMEPSEPSQ